MKKCLQEVRESFDIEKIDKFIDSVPDRIREVINYEREW